MAAATAAPAGPETVEDDGTLLLVRTATDNPTLHALVDTLEEQIPKANEALRFADLVASEQGKTAFSDVAMRARFAQQSRRNLLAIMETIQQHVEKSDSLNPLGKPGEVRMARKALVRFAQVTQEILERARDKVEALIRILGPDAEAPEPAKKKHKWDEADSQEAPLHEKYKHIFNKAKTEETQQEAPRANGNVAPTDAKPLIVKYQGRGENPPPTDNLYIKNLPGTVTEMDIEEIFSQVGTIMSKKLKTADWGAIAFVRMETRAQAAAAIERFHNTVPEQLRAAGSRRVARAAGEAESTPASAAAPAAAAEVDVPSALPKATEEGACRLQRPSLVRVSLAQPLGVVFDDDCLARDVAEGSQGERLGFAPGARVKSCGGRPITKGVEQLVRRIGRAKQSGASSLLLGVLPAPVIATFASRPFGFAIRLDDESGLFVTGDAGGQALEQGVSKGMALVAINGVELVGLDIDGCFQRLKEASLPCKVVFKIIPSESAEGVQDSEMAGSSDEEGVEANRGKRVAELVPREDAVAHFRVDLSKPLGIFFDKVGTVERVGEGFQAECLGVPPGARAVRVGGEPVEGSTEKLVSRIKSAKEAGDKHLVLSLILPPARAMDVCEGIAAAFEVDLSRPLGIHFDKRCCAELISPGSQASELAVPAGARVLLLDGRPAPGTTEELVKKVGALKKAAVKTMRLTFLLPPEAQPEEAPPAKRPRQSPALAAAPSAPSRSAPSHAAPAVAPSAPAAAPSAPVAARSAPSPSAPSPPPAASSAPAGSSPLVRTTMDLARPLGIFFCKACVVERLGEGTQAAELGVPVGAQVWEVDGEALDPRTSAELVRRVKSAKAAGAASMTLGFSVTGAGPTATPAAAEPAPTPEGPRATEEGLASLSRPSVVRVDLARPLGVFFDKRCIAERIWEKTQAEELGVPVAAQVRRVNGEEIPRLTTELVKRIGDAKKEGAKSIELEFALPEVTVDLDDRPFGLALALDAARGVFTLREATGHAAAKGARAGLALAAVGGQGLAGRSLLEVERLLAEAALPVRLALRHLPLRG